VSRVGDRSAPDTAQYRVGNVSQQLAQRLTMPERGRISELGAWLRGVTGYGSIDYRLVLWRWDGSTGAPNTILGRTASHSSTAAAFDVGSLTQQTWPLEAPVDVDAGDELMVGFASDTGSGSACQWGVRSGGGTHYLRDLGAGAAWPVSMHGAHSDSRDLAAWIEAYTPLAGAWVRRSGAWVLAADVSVRRSGAWASASSTQVRRSGGWTDAS
jgi:hypothetical protein